MRVYWVLYISGENADKRLRVTIPHYYRDNQIVWIGNFRARILEMIR